MLQEAIRQSGFSMVDVSYDAEISYKRLSKCHEVIIYMG